MKRISIVLGVLALIGAGIYLALPSLLPTPAIRTADEGTWYHPVEAQSWAAKGGNLETINAVLARIGSNTGTRRVADQPDTMIEFGPGNWIYEFSAAGDAAMRNAELAPDQAAQIEILNEAVVYYLTASSPHINAAQNIAAFEKALDAYRQAAALVMGEFQEIALDIEGKSATAFLHLPPGDGPFPVLVSSSGSDQSSVNSLNFYRQHLLPRGIAYLSVDVPGMGRSRNLDMADGISDKVHAAAIEWAKTENMLDDRNIFAAGASFGGHAVARLFLARPELDLAGVIYLCGPLHGPFLAPAVVYDTFPKFTMDGVKARLGLDPDATSKTLVSIARRLSLKDQGLYVPGNATPILAINTNADPVADLEDMDEFLANATQATRVVLDMPGHCMPRYVREPIMTAWILDNFR